MLRVKPLDRVTIERILALDPERISEGEVHQHGVRVALIEWNPTVQEALLPALLLRRQQQTCAPAAGKVRIQRRPVSGAQLGGM